MPTFDNVMFCLIAAFCAAVIAALGIWALKRRTPMHFWSGSTIRPEEISDIPAYNRANAVMWLSYAAVLLLSGIAGLFNVSAGGIIMTAVAVPGMFVLIAVYTRIYRKYSVSGASRPEKDINAGELKTVVIIIIALSALGFIVIAAAFMIRAFAVT